MSAQKQLFPTADGFANLRELRAGTDPGDSRSALRIIMAGFEVANRFALTWSSALTQAKSDSTFAQIKMD